MFTVSEKSDVRPFGPLRDIQTTDRSMVIMLKDGRLQASSPHAGILRLLCARPHTHRRNFSVAVLESAPLNLSYQAPNYIEADGVSLTLQPDGTAQVAATGLDGRLNHLFELSHVAAVSATYGESASREGVEAHLTVGNADPFFGMGEHPGPMNRRHLKLISYNRDLYPHVTGLPSFYSSFPFYLCRTDGGAWYGVLLDYAGRAYLDLAATREDEVRLRVESGDLDLYVLAGPTPREVVRRYTQLTGRLRMPPPWYLGYQQSRWSYTPASRVLELAREFRRNKFPCDVIYLDIDYLDRHRSFTWHPQDFKDHGKLLAELHKLGFKVVPILNSAVATDDDHPVYREGKKKGYFLTQPDGQLYHDRMWPGDCAFPDFTREDVRDWWGDLHRDLLNEGADGLWNDMNEPTIFGESPEMLPGKTFPDDLPHQGEGIGRPHVEVHNAYGMLMCQSTREAVERLRPRQRTPILTRSAYCGIQRHAYMWTGDNASWWEHMPLAISTVANLGLCGMPMSGPDVGGFWGDCHGELFLRWMQMGVFFPYLRAHTAKGTRDQEPWSFGDEVLEISRRFANLRYELLPYLYTLAAEAARHGDPMLRPMFFEYPQDPHALVADDQFLLGRDLLVAPIMAPGKMHRAVYLPAGEWYSYFAGARYEGGLVRVAEVPADHIPVYVRANAILPMGPRMQYVGEKIADRVYWHVWVGEGEGSGWLYDDDGQTAAEDGSPLSFCETHVHGQFGEEALRLHFDARIGHYRPSTRRFEVVVHGLPHAPRKCSLPGVSVRDGLVHVEFEDGGSPLDVTMEW